MSAYSVRIVVASTDQVPVLDVQVFETETFLDRGELIGDDFLEADPLIVQYRHQSIVIAPVAERVVAGPALFVHVQLLLHVLHWRARLNRQVEGNVLEVEVARDVNGRPAQLVLLHEQLQDVILVQFLVSLRESIHNLRELAPVHHREDARTVDEIFWPETDRQVHEPFLVLLDHLVCF